MSSFSTRTCLVLLLLAVARVLAASTHVPATPGGGHPESTAVFADDKVYEIVINVTPERLASMLVIDKPVVPANVTVDGVSFTEVGLNYKGGQSTWTACFSGTTFNKRQCPEQSFAVTFNKYNDSQTFHGLTKIALNCLMYDNTALHDKLSVQLYLDAGVIAERVTYAHVVVNGVDKGLFTMMEYLSKKVFAKDRFPKSEGFSDHVPYKDAWPVFANNQYYVEHIETDLEANDSKNSLAFVNSFAVELGKALQQQAKPLQHNILLGEPTHPLVQVVRRHMDMNYLVRMAIVDRLMQANDGCMVMFVNDIKNTSTKLEHAMCSGSCAPHNCAFIHVRNQDVFASSGEQDRLYPGEHDHDLNWGGGIGFGGGGGGGQATMQTLFDQDWFNYSTNAKCQNGGGGGFFSQLPPRCDPIWRAVGMNGVRAVIDTYRSLRNSQQLDAPRLQAMLARWAKLVEPYMQANLSSWRTAVNTLNGFIASRIQTYDALMTKLDTNECKTNNGGCGNNQCLDDFIGSHCSTTVVTPPAATACDSYPCGLHGVCSPSGASFKCVCYEAYTGDTCSVAPLYVEKGSATPTTVASNAAVVTPQRKPTTPATINVADEEVEASPSASSSSSSSWLVALVAAVALIGVITVALVLRNRRRVRTEAYHALLPEQGVAAPANN